MTWSQSLSIVYSMKINFSANDVGITVLRRAVALAETIESKQAELRALLRGQTSPRKSAKSVSRKGRFSPAQRAKISQGLKAKWAERKAAKNTSPAIPVGTPVAASSGLAA